MLDLEDASFVTAIPHGSTDSRAPSGSNRTLVNEDGLKLTESRFDMDLSWCNIRLTSRSATQHDVSDRVFGATEIIRTKLEVVRDEETYEDEVTYARKRRRLAGLPVIERFVSLLMSRILLLRRIHPYTINFV